MKVFHVVFSDPIGPSWIAYITRPEIIPNEKGLYIQSWVEEVELTKLTAQFADHIVAEREMGHTDNSVLDIRVA